MGAITQPMIDAAYRLAKEVHHLRKSEGSAVQDLERMGMSPGSAKMYIDNFSRMMVGERITRTMSKASFATFLNGIYNDYGEKALSNALKATFANILYYERCGRGRLVGVEDIANEFKRRYLKNKDS